MTKWGIETFDCAYWLWIGKHVIRVGRPWNKHGYKYAWRPLLKMFRAYK